MQDTPAQGKVWAKTGTVAGVSALSGYLVAPNGHYIAFSIINQGVKLGSEGRRFQDRVCNALCQP
jgi:D-alanyl-D-alanine carboxypeptidase/D-alanyl-D-alanine-endopeptidase (penicillin-binding protein 4)